MDALRINLQLLPGADSLVIEELINLNKRARTRRLLQLAYLGVLTERGGLTATSSVGSNANAATNTNESSSNNGNTTPPSSSNAVEGEEKVSFNMGGIELEELGGIFGAPFEQITS